MRANVRLGRVAGIEISANVGALVIVLLVGLGLAGGQFPQQYPGRPFLVYASAGLIAGLLITASILIHELAHALVARGAGIDVEGITLWLLGGVARLRGEPRSPAAELAVALVGPLTSLALGGVFAAAAFAVRAATGGGLAVATLGYLAGANVLLALFNLVPAAPLDGGRVLRGVLWWRSGDRDRAAISAARAGRVFGIGLIILGFAQLLLLRGFGGLWLALIGWFLVHAASAEENQVRLGQRLSGVRVRDVMSASAVTAPAEAKVSEFIDDVVLRQPYSTYPLVDDEGRLTGLVTLNRIRALPLDRRAETRLADIACPPPEVPTAAPDDAVTDLLPRIDGCTDGRAVALDEDRRVVGVVSPRDVARLASAAEFRTPQSLQGADLATTRV
ncbi:site-2 protease family protein [Micromonospora pattaloongensis]|uniref:site-2 protease family protein n=1 Tax=Micromonospora pattaloongensis TaxID=405436 RepID=UPI000B8726B1|nr:site-2 protease family protein [Micromonospora pattaloongensis]